MGYLELSDTVRVSAIVAVSLIAILVVTRGLALPCVGGTCVVVEPIISLSRLFKFSILLLTVIGFVFSYENWTSPKTNVLPEKTRQVWDERTGDYGIVLKNNGTVDATLRVKVRIDGEEPFPDRPDAANCLYAKIPYSSPFPGQDPYPKRSQIAREDFRLFKNTKEWIIDLNAAGGRTVETGSTPLPSLPIDGDRHEVHFEIQQTGEHYVFTYDSDGDVITDIEREQVEELERTLR